VFTPDGKYQSQVFINRAGPSDGSVAGFAFSPDPQQRFLYAADYGNSHLVVLDRKSMQVLYQFGTRSATPGNFQCPHLIASDSKGNLYVAEVAPGNRAQKFLCKGMSQTPPPNALTPAQLSATQ
jgi:DNA-binding beta-propeller fold protein YncE